MGLVREEKGAWLGLGLVLEEEGAWLGLVLKEEGAWLGSVIAGREHVWVWFVKRMGI